MDVGLNFGLNLGFNGPGPNLGMKVLLRSWDLSWVAQYWFGVSWPEVAWQDDFPQNCQSPTTKHSPLQNEITHS